MARHIVARTTDIPPGGNKVVGVDGRDIVVFHVNGEAVESGEELQKGPCVAETFAVHVEDSYVIIET